MSEVRLIKFAQIFLLSLIFSMGCQQKPTQVVSSKNVLVKDPRKSNLITDETVILDARNPFEFNANHIPGSINVQWSDFTQHQPEVRGVLDSDLFGIARRLALWGIDPSTSVLVIGKVVEGNGEDGRVAWMLSHLGIKKIQIAKFDLFRGRVTNTAEPEPTPKNKEIWMPNDADLSELSWQGFMEKLTPYRYDFKFLKPYLVDWKEGNRVGRFLNSKLRFLDVRSHQEFKRFNLTQLDPKFVVTHIEWTKFFNADGSIKSEMKSELEKLEWQDQDNIIVISEDGVSSAAVTFALKENGFTEAENFSGGYVQIEYELGRKVVAKPKAKSKTKSKLKKSKK